MQTHSQQTRENKYSSLILKEDNDQVFSLLDPRCQSLSTTVIQLFITHPPHHSQWVKKDTGILCFVKDNHKKNYFFRLYCLRRNCMIWEQEVYSNMEYINSCEFLHTFEGDECMIAFNFASVPEANELKDTVDRKLLAKRHREKQSKNRVTLKDQTPRLPSMNDINAYKKTTSAAEISAKRRRNITKADIGNPSEFRHVSHVGFNPDKGFDIDCNDPQLNEIFEQAGISAKELENKKIRKFIYGFINTHGGRQAVQEEVQKTRKTAPAPPSPVSGPPVPPRGAGRSTRAAPPPPPPSSQVQRTPKASRNIQASGPPVPPPSAVPPPPAMPPTCVAPPPPPLPPPMELNLHAELQAPAQPQLPAQPDHRSALMESIRGGTILKPVNSDKQSQPTDNPRGDLMSEIRKGFQLKPANEREIKPTSPLPEVELSVGLAGALARALAERNRVTHSEDDSSTSDTDSNDEWDA